MSSGAQIASSYTSGFAPLIDTSRIFSPQGVWEGRNVNSEPSHDADISIRVIGWLQDAFKPENISGYEYYFKVVTENGVVSIAGATFTLRAYEAFNQCVDVVKKMANVKAVLVVDVAHASVSNGDEYFGYAGEIIEMRNLFSALRADYAKKLKSFWALKMDVVNGQVRIRGRVEFADDYFKFKGCTLARYSLHFPQATTPIDISTVTRSELASTVLSAGVQG